MYVKQKIITYIYIYLLLNNNQQIVVMRYRGRVLHTAIYNVCVSELRSFDFTSNSYSKFPKTTNNKQGLDSRTHILLCSCGLEVEIERIHTTGHKIRTLDQRCAECMAKCWFSSSYEFVSENKNALCECFICFKERDKLFIFIFF